MPQGTTAKRPPDKKTILRLLNYGKRLKWFQWFTLPTYQNNGEVGVVLPNGVTLSEELQLRIEV